MATKIVTKNSSTASAVPTASDLVQGELAVNVADKRLFTEDNGGSIVELGTNPSTIDINAGTIDGTAIGASSASTGAFTTLTATGLDVTGTATMDGLTVDGTGDGVKATIGKTGGTNLNIYADTNTVYLAGSSALSTAYIIDQTNNNMQFKVNAAERMRIDSSGNLLVGKTAADGGVNGGEMRANGETYLTATSAQPLALNRKSTDGALLNFSKDGTSVGSIGVEGGQAYISGTSNGLHFNGTTIRPSNNLGVAVDNTVDLGQSVYRFDDIYATNGTIQTSDRNEKQDIAELSDAEQRVAVACKSLLRKFRWKDSVAEKGDDARTHFGIIAQDLQAAFAAEGLDAGDYAMFISTTWTDEETNEEKTRMGVRYSELLAFIIAAI